jgi:hypothetical protein
VGCKKSVLQASISSLRTISFKFFIVCASMTRIVVLKDKKMINWHRFEKFLKSFYVASDMYLQNTLQLMTNSCHFVADVHLGNIWNLSQQNMASKFGSVHWEERRWTSRTKPSYESGSRSCVSSVW